MTSITHRPQRALMRAQAFHQRWRDGGVSSQSIEDDFTDGIDLIGIGVLQLFPSFVAVGFSQHVSQKW